MTQKISRFLVSVYMELARHELILLGIWMLTMIGLPIILWISGDATLVFGIIAGVLAQLILVVTLLIRAWGPAKALGVTFFVTVFAWAAEAVGTAIGFPFGHYTYTQVLQPQILDVPLLIPLAWMMMLPAAWAVASLVAPIKRIWLFSTISALAMTSWDLFLDPQMVDWGIWAWDIEGAYFGIPLINFLGWFSVSFMITLIIKPAHLPVLPLLAVYVITWLLQTIGQLFFWNLPGPALFGFLGMGGTLLMSPILRKWISRQRKTTQHLEPDVSR
jgi:lycopene beta-cyclase